MTKMPNKICMSGENIVVDSLTKQLVFSGIFDPKNCQYLEKWSGIKVADFERGSLGQTKFFKCEVMVWLRDLPQKRRR